MNSALQTRLAKVNSIRWWETSEEFPCSVCGKAGWCSGSDDGVWAICRRNGDGTGEHKVDASGTDYWLYKLKESSAESVPKDDPPKVPERAAPETLDRVYGALLDELPLSHSHRQDLHRRGLSEGEIKRRGYRTLPSRDREGRAAKLVERFGSEVCSKVPGLYEKESDPAGWSVAGAAGILIPVRDTEGRIVALKVRADDPGEGPKYSYLSSSKRGGPGPGAQVHVPLSEDPDRGAAARLTEGELKADVATTLSGMLSVSVPGVSSWRNALPVRGS